MKKIFFLLIGLMLCTAAFAQSTVNIYVSPDGTNLNAGNTSDANPTTLHTAVLYIDTVTVSGETNFNIWMLGGTYTDASVQIVQRANKNLHFEAKGDAECTVETPFQIDGAKRAYDAETITIKNLNFNGLNMITGVVVVSSEMAHCTPHNITVESCTFKGVDDSSYRAIFFPTKCCVFDLTLKNCSCDANSEGFLGADGGINNVLIDNCIIKSKRGVNLQHSKNIVISNSRFELSTNKYAIRVGQSSGSPVHGTVLISNCKISGLGNDDPLIVMRGDCPDTLLLENDSLIVTGDAGVAYELPAGVVAVVKENSTLVLNGKPNPNNERLIGVDKTSKLTVGADDLYSELKVADGVFQWDNTSNTWVVADTQYVYPAGIDKNIDNAVAKSIKHENNRDIVYFFTSVPDAVDFMTKTTPQICSMNPLGLDSVGVNVIKNNTLPRTITVSTGKKVTLLDDKTVTYRGESISSTLITIENNATLTLGAIEEDDTLVFDGGNMGKYFPFVSNKGTLIINGNVIFQNNNNTSGGSAIQIEQDGKMIVNGDLVFQDNTTTEIGGAVLMNERSTLDIYGKTKFLHNIAGNNGGAISMKSSSAFTVHEGAEVDFIGNKAKLGSSIYASSGSVYLNGIVNVKKNVAENGSLYAYFGKQYISGKVTISEDTITNGALIYNKKTSLKMSDGEIMNNFIKGNASDCYGVIAVIDANDTLVGGKIHDNVISVDNAQNLSPKPASVVLSLTEGIKRLYLGDSTMVDTINLVHKDEKNQVVWLLSNLTKVSATSPIILQVDTFDVNVFQKVSLIATNYMKFKPSSDTLAINNKGYVVRKPEISIDTVYLLQKGTKYEDYGITTITGEVDMDKIYVEYTQTVDAHGNDNTIKSDSTIIEMNVTYNSNVSKVRQKIAAQENGKKVFTISFNSDLWDVKPSAGILDSGLYKVEIDTLIVHTLGVSAGMKGTLEKDVNIPYFNIDTLNFLLAGTKFSDFGYCGVDASTNDGDGNDVVPGDEIYVEYTRTGAIDTAFVTVTIQDGNQSVTYNEGTPAGSTFSVGCGSFRSFLDNTGIGQFTPNALQLVDDVTYTCEVSMHVKADDDPYFAIANKTFTYKHDIDREAIFALDTAEDRDEKYNNIGIVLNNYDDSLALTYPSAFSVAKAQELGMIDNTDKCVYVILTADPVDETIRVESANQAIDLLSNAALNSNNYSTDGYGVQDGKLLMAVKVSEPVAENAVVVPAINFALDSVLRWCSVIGASTGVENPYHTYRTYYKVSGETAHDTTVVAYNQMSYRKTGVSGVKLHNSNGQASFMYHPEDYTVWAAQDPTPGLNLDGKVWLALYVAAPNENVKQVYSHPATNTPSGEVSSIVTLADDLANRVTATQAVNYYPVGTCANYANKDYTFYTNDKAYENNYLYWFDENSKLLSVQHFNVAVKAAPKYTVNFNFNGGGATCNTPYADNFADSTYIFGRKINRPADPFKCGHLFMDWRHGVDSFTVDSFNNVRAGISEATGETVSAEAFGIRSNMVIDAAWKYFVTLSNPHDTAVVADYSLCEISTRDYVWEPTESQLPYVYTFHTDYLGKYYRDYLTAGNANCDVRFEADAFTENPTVLPVGSTSHVTWTVTDMCGTPFTISQNVNVKFPPCGTDNYNPRLYPFTPYETTYKAIDYEGNTYETVRMGCVCWTKENLKSLKYADGEDIPVANAYFDQEENADEFGRLYSWYSAVKLPENSDIEISSLNVDNRPQGVCPTGWYLPRGEDFVRMSDLDIIQGTSSPVKTDGSNNYWLGHEVGDNSTGFSAKPAGFYNPADERYCNLLGDTYFWSSSSTTTITAPCCALTHSCPTILIQNNNKGNGYSVRCIKYKKFDD